MKKVIITLLGLLIVGGLFFIFKKQSDNENLINKVPNAETTIKTAWVEVERGTLFLKLPGQSKELKSGDEIESGASLETGKNSSALIHFPDGSILSLDKETSIQITNLQFETANKTLTAKVALSVGRVWSKVVSLATPESEWEVKTSNTVATVRGTAFGMGFKNGTSWVNTSENKVAVAPLDPEINEKIVEAEIIIEEKKYVELADINIKELVSIREKATSSESSFKEQRDFFEKKIADVPKIISEDSWVKEVKTKHVKLDQELEELKKKSEILNDKDDYRDKYRDLKEETRQAIIKGSRVDTHKLIEKVLDPKYKNDIEVKIESESTKSTETVKRKAIEELQRQTSKTTDNESRANSSAEFTQTIKASLVIVPTTELSSINEGETITWRVFLVQGDKREDVTLSSKLEVVGEVGNINERGVFSAKLIPELSEFGQSVGAIRATYEKGDIKLIGKSKIFIVKVKALEIDTDIGGQ